jgi:hypothetical protein
MDKDTQQQIQEEVQKAFDKNYFSAIPKIPPHQHNGVDNLQIDPAQSLLGFPIMNAVPTDNAGSGTIRLYFDGTNYRLYARIGTDWKGVILS